MVELSENAKRARGLLHNVARLRASGLNYELIGVKVGLAARTVEGLLGSISGRNLVEHYRSG